MDISPSKEQSDAIKAIVEWYGKKQPQEFYLAGYAGVGKSTIANIAIEEIKQKYGIEKVRTAAYTGKAASVLRRKGVASAQTIHTLIYTPHLDSETGELSFTLSEKSDANDADLIVLDECSMVDHAMAKDLRSFGKKILIMGDPGQLPPVGGQGAFTNREPDVFLQEIHRQVADSPILHLATLARRGEPMPTQFNAGSVSVRRLTGSEELIHDPNTQLICGLNRVRWDYSQKIRKRLGFDGKVPVVGERILCCRNNRQEGLFNGGMGVLEAIATRHDGTPGTYSINAKMDDRREPNEGIEIDPYLFDNHFTNGQSKKLEIPRKWFDEFDWAYCITAHKAQGSQFPHVTIIDDSRCFRENAGQWLYTAISRAEEGLTLLTRS